MSKTTLPADYQQKVLSGAPGTELHSYNDALPLMMVRYMGPGLLGLGITALIAGFMSGMAGNVSAFSTVWTYDIYKPLINKKGSDSHYVLVGRWSIFIGVLVSIGAGYLVQHAHGIMDYVQALFSFFIAPLLAAILMGMFWKRATAPAGFLGLLIGISSSIGMFVYVKMNPAGLATIALVSRRQADGRESLSRLVGLLHRGHCHLPGQPGHQAQAGRRVGWTLLQLHGSAQGRAGSVLQERLAVGILAVCIFAALNIFSGNEWVASPFEERRKDHESCMVQEFKSGFSLACCC